MTANEHQVDGNHYRQEGVIQHWDYAASQNFDYFQGQITKYITRWRKKNGVKDLEKAKHFLEKYIELETIKNKAPNLVYGKNTIDFQACTAAAAFCANKREDNTGQQYPFGYDPVMDSIHCPPKHNEKAAEDIFGK